MHAFSFNINIQANHNLAKALQYWMVSMHYCKQKPDFLNPLFNSLIEEEKLYPQVCMITYWKRPQKMPGYCSKKISWSRSELLRFNCIIVERSLTELFMIIFLRWWDSNQRAAIYSDTPSASLYHKQARNGCTYMRYVPRHFKDNIVVACTVKFLII